MDSGRGSAAHKSHWYTPCLTNECKLLTPHVEVAQGLDLLWRNNVNPSKVVMGIGFYGRSFTLRDPTCNRPGCPFSGGARPGECTQTSGVLSNAEIQRIIDRDGLTPILDAEAGVKYINWDGDQWVSYDDAKTIQLKKDFANRLCLGGLMVWALDQEDRNNRRSSLDLLGDSLKFSDEVGDAHGEFYQNRLIAHDTLRNYKLGIFWTECERNPTCPTNFKPIAFGHGKVSLRP